MGSTIALQVLLECAKRRGRGRTAEEVTDQRQQLLLRAVRVVAALQRGRCRRVNRKCRLRHRRRPCGRGVWLESPPIVHQGASFCQPRLRGPDQLDRPKPEANPNSLAFFWQEATAPNATKNGFLASQSR